MSESDDPQQAPAPADERQELLERGALALGEQWMNGTCEALREQGRRITGGWPGTLSEARARVLTYWEAELRRRYLPQLTTEETESLTRCTYAHARRAWLARAPRNGALVLTKHGDLEPG